MLNYYDQESELGITEQLYTARGSQGLGTFDKIDTYGVDPAKYEEQVLLLYENPYVTANYKMRPLFTTKANPDWMSLPGLPYGMIQIPLYL